MRLINALLPAALLSFTIIACSQSDPNNIAIDDPDNAVDAAAMNIGAPPEAANGEDMAAPTDAAVIPAQYRGRWGMVPADCTSSRGDTKGLITVDDKTIRFYESTATLNEQRPAIATSFAGLYGFTGEGQRWEKVVTLTRTGDTLKRSDDEGSYSYTRC